MAVLNWNYFIMLNIRNCMKIAPMRYTDLRTYSDTAWYGFWAKECLFSPPVCCQQERGLQARAWVKWAQARVQPGSSRAGREKMSISFALREISHNRVDEKPRGTDLPSKHQNAECSLCLSPGSAPWTAACVTGCGNLMHLKPRNLVRNVIYNNIVSSRKQFCKWKK